MGLGDLDFEVQSLPEFYRLFDTLKKSSQLPFDVIEYLRKQQLIEEWTESRRREEFKMKVAGAILSLLGSLEDALVKDLQEPAAFR